MTRSIFRSDLSYNDPTTATLHTLVCLSGSLDWVEKHGTGTTLAGMCRYARVWEKKGLRKTGRNLGMCRYAWVWRGQRRAKMSRKNKHRPA